MKYLLFLLILLNGNYFSSFIFLYKYKHVKYYNNTKDTLVYTNFCKPTKNNKFIPLSQYTVQDTTIIDLTYSEKIYVNGHIDSNRLLYKIDGQLTEKRLYLFPGNELHLYVEKKYCKKYIKYIFYNKCILQK